MNLLQRLYPIANEIKARVSLCTKECSKRKLRVVLNIARDSDDVLVKKIDQAVEARPDELEIVIQHRGTMEQDTVLILWDILSNRDKKTHLKVNVRSSITDGLLLLVLMADSRVIRKYTYAVLEDPRKVREPDFERSETDRFSYYTCSPDTFRNDYLQTVELMNQYIEVTEICGKKWNLENLKDYYLFATIEEEESFQRMLEKDLCEQSVIQ